LLPIQLPRVGITADCPGPRRGGRVQQGLAKSFGGFIFSSFFLGRQTPADFVLGLGTGPNFIRPVFRGTANHAGRSPLSFAGFFPPLVNPGFSLTRKLVGRVFKGPGGAPGAAQSGVTVDDRVGIVGGRVRGATYGFFVKKGRRGGPRGGGGDFSTGKTGVRSLIVLAREENWGHKFGWGVRGLCFGRFECGSGTGENGFAGFLRGGAGTKTKKQGFSKTRGPGRSTSPPRPPPGAAGERVILKGFRDRVLGGKTTRWFQTKKKISKGKGAPGPGVTGRNAGLDHRVGTNPKTKGGGG